MPLLAVEHNIMIPLNPDNLESEPMESLFCLWVNECFGCRKGGLDAARSSSVLVVKTVTFSRPILC
jgi:hypothetical protein